MTPLSHAAVPAALRSVERPVVWVLLDADPLPAWVDHPHPLTADELARVTRTRHQQTREQFVRGRTVLRAALGLALNLPPHQVPLVLTPDGKPELDPHAGLPPLHFNLSHTDGVIAFAVSPIPVGIDVETHRPGRDLDGLVDRYFAPEEQDQFRELPDPLRPAGFLRGWTGKEALLKGIGCGVRELSNCVVELDPRQPGRVIRTPAGCGAWDLACWAITDRTAVAVAVREGW